MTGPGKIVVEPDPAIEGRQVTVEYSGAATQIYWSDDFSDWKPLSLDASGRATITVPAGTRELQFTDKLGTTVYVEVVRSGS